MITPLTEDVAQPGDVDTTPYGYADLNDYVPDACKVRSSNGYICTRKTHAGQHVCGTGVIVAAVWTGDGDVRQCWCPMTGSRRTLDPDCPSHGNPLLEVTT